GSGLFEDQPEFAEIAKDEEMVQDMLDHIPDVLTQLYLLFQAPEEKARPALLDPRHCSAPQKSPALPPGTAGLFFVQALSAPLLASPAATQRVSRDTTRSTGW